MIVVVHAAVVQKQLSIGAKQLEKGRTFLPLLDLFVGKHGVFAIGNAGAGLFQIILGGKASAASFPCLTQQSKALTLVTDKLKGLSSCQLFKLPDNAGAHTVDGTKFQPVGVFRAEHLGKAAAQIVGCRHRVGHCQNAFGWHTVTINQIAHPRKQCSGFTASGYRQQQHRAFGLCNSRLLLPVQLERKLPAEGCKIHHLCRNRRLFSSANTRSEKSPTSTLSSTSR